jgi:chorismate mutase/prephenate dehydrogenase
MAARLYIQPLQKPGNGWRSNADWTSEDLMTVLHSLREQLDKIDKSLVDLISSRQRIIDEIAIEKKSAGIPSRDFAREEKVVRSVRHYAKSVGVAEDVAESVLRIMIQYSLARQELDRITRAQGDDGRKALIIGGAGRMGRWLSTFMRRQGIAVEIADPKADGHLPNLADWQSDSLDHTFVVVSTPLEVTSAVLHKLAELQPGGIVFDVCALKGPVLSGIRALLASGVRTASINPMFEPESQFLSGRNIVFADTGDKDSMESVRALFACTLAGQTTIDISEHDQLMAYVLGLTVAVNSAFVAVLTASRKPVHQLLGASTPEFSDQLHLAREIAHQSPHSQYFLHKLNTHGDLPLEALAHAIDTLRKQISKGAEGSFIEMTKRCQAYTSDRRSRDSRRSDTEDTLSADARPAR